MFKARPFLVLIFVLADLVLLPSRGWAQREELLLSSRPPPKGQRCAISDREPPALQAMVDSAGLHDDLLRLLKSEDAAEGYTLLSLEVDSTGSFARSPGVVESDLPELTAAMVAGYVAARAAPEGINEHRYARLKVTLDSLPRFKVGHSETCRPELSNRREVTGYVAGAGTQTKRSGTAVLKLFVTVNGRITDMVIQQSSGDDKVDRLALGVARHMRFQPARVDYIPVPVWVSIPVTINAR
jgi:TonB family protein